MNVYFCNINKINEDVEDFVIAKNKIEQPLIDEEKLEKKMSINEFLDYIDITQNIFMSNDEKNISIPFNIYKPTMNNTVVIYAADKINSKYEDLFKNNLNEINYNLSKLNEISQLDMLQGNIENKPYYIINNCFYT